MNFEDYVVCLLRILITNIAAEMGINYRFLARGNYKNFRGIIGAIDWQSQTVEY